MKIGIDARLLERPMTGIGRYLSNLLRYLPAMDPANEYILFSYRPLTGFNAPNVRSVATMDAVAGGSLQKVRSFFWLHTVLPRFLKKEKIDIFFSPNTLLPFFGTGVKNVITIHDVFYLINPHFHSPIYRAYLSFFLSRAIKNADLILAVSEASKRDIVRLLHVPEEKIVVTYLAAEERFAPRLLSSVEKVHYQKKYGLPERFVLYVGVIEQRKNIEGIVKVADELAKRGGVSGDNIPIVLAGRAGYGGGWYLDEIKKRANMHYVGFFDDPDLPYLYNLAELFFFPSFYEGFGLPPLEAMQSGVPVIASNISSVPEVVGNAGILIDPRDTNGLVAGIVALLGNVEKRKELVEKGSTRAKKFSFKNTAQKTLEAFRILS